jgi:hypothetical protein
MSMTYSQQLVLLLFLLLPCVGQRFALKSVKFQRILHFHREASDNKIDVLARDKACN